MTQYSISVKGKEVTITNINSNSITIYDVCDLDGKILYTNEIPKELSTCLIDLTDLESGHYHIYLINEGNIFKELIVL